MPSARSFRLPKCYLIATPIERLWVFSAFSIVLTTRKSALQYYLVICPFVRDYVVVFSTGQIANARTSFHLHTLLHSQNNCSLFVRSVPVAYWTTDFDIKFACCEKCIITNKTCSPRFTSIHTSPHSSFNSAGNPRLIAIEWIFGYANDRTLRLSLWRFFLSALFLHSLCAACWICLRFTKSQSNRNDKSIVKMFLLLSMSMLVCTFHNHLFGSSIYNNNSQRERKRKKQQQRQQKNRTKSLLYIGFGWRRFFFFCSGVRCVLFVRSLVYGRFIKLQLLLTHILLFSFVLSQWFSLIHRITYRNEEKKRKEDKQIVSLWIYFWPR